jgi:L-fuculose-phosphate aldolase
MRAPELPEFDRAAPTSAEKEARRKLCEFVHRAYRQRLFISTQGSFSARLDANSFLITPYHVDRSLLEPRDLALIRDGRAEAGSLPSRATGAHAAIYEQHPNVGAIINAYPVNATAFSVCGELFDSRIIPESYVVLRHVGRAPYGLQFENPDKLAQMISVDQPSVLLENDGVLVTGANILEGFDRLEVLESTAEAIINSKAIGTLAPMPDRVITELDRVFLGKHTA